MQESNQYHERERAAASVMNKYAKRKAQSERNKTKTQSALRHTLCAMLYAPYAMRYALCALRLVYG